MLCNTFRSLDETELLEMAKFAKGKIKAIVMHWTAGNYGHVYDDYHFCINSDGSFDVPLGRQIDCLGLVLAHTWRRNTGVVGIAIEAARGANCKNTDEAGLEIVWGKKAVPTPEQIDGLARAVAIICYGSGIPLNNDCVVTHAEIASVDGYGYEDDDPEMKWDLLRLPGQLGNGGDIIRSRAESYLTALQKGVFPWKEQG